MTTLDADQFYVGGSLASRIYVGADRVHGGSRYDEVVLASSPLIYLPLTADANDLSANALNGTIVGTPTFDPVKGMNFEAGIYVDLPNSALLRPTTAASMEAWVEPSSMPNAGHCLWVGSDNPFQNWTVQGSAANRVRVQTDTNPAGGQADVTTATNSIMAGNRYHLVWTFNGTQIRVYRDGALLAGPTTTGGGPLEWNAVAQRLGARMNGTEQFFGRISHFAMYGTSLGPTAITQRYNVGTAA